MFMCYVASEDGLFCFSQSMLGKFGLKKDLFLHSLVLIIKLLS